MVMAVDEPTVQGILQRLPPLLRAVQVAGDLVANEPPPGRLDERMRAIQVGSVNELGAPLP